MRFPHRRATKLDDYRYLSATNYFEAEIFRNIGHNNVFIFASSLLGWARRCRDILDAMRSSPFSFIPLYLPQSVLTWETHVSFATYTLGICWSYKWHFVRVLFLLDVSLKKRRERIKSLLWLSTHRTPNIYTKLDGLVSSYHIFCYTTDS